MRIGAAVIGAVLLLGACAGAGEDPETTDVVGEAAVAAFGPEEITFGEALAQIRGHHDAATELYERGDVDLALVHASHPINEILASVSGELEEHAPEQGEELGDTLEEVLNLIEDEVSESEVATAVERAAELTFDAELQVIGNDAGTPAYTGSVIGALLSTAAHEYEEAIAGGDEISLLEEYQDGYAFVAEARDLYESIVADVEAASVEEAEEIDEAFDELDAAFPSLEAPEQPLPAEPVAEAAALIGHELEETVNAQPVESADPEEVVENIEDLLDEVIETYADGDADAAGELAAEAYLENYEVIEAGVIEAAPEVNEELEPLLGADLRAEISAGAPVEDIEAMVERAEELLAEALEALEEAH